MTNDELHEQQKRYGGEAYVVIRPEQAAIEPGNRWAMLRQANAGRTMRVGYGASDRRTATTCAVFVVTDDGQEFFKVQIPSEATFVKGNGRRNVWFEPAGKLGKSSMMGRIAYGIRSGRMFRGGRG